MSSTKNSTTVDPLGPQILGKIRRFYDVRLTPSAHALRKKHLTLFALEPDSSRATYYETRMRTHMAPADFEEGGCLSPDDLQSKLECLWQNGGVRGGGQTVGSELSKLAAPIAALAKEIYAVEEQDADVAPFMYVMF